VKSSFAALATAIETAKHAAQDRLRKQMSGSKQEFVNAQLDEIILLLRRLSGREDDVRALLAEIEK
jgi:hypothetical protein